MADTEMAPAGADGIADEQGTEGIAEDGGAAAAAGSGIADEQKAEAGKDQMDGNGAEGKSTAPEPYELAAPADFPLPEANLKSFSDACNRLGLSREQAEGMLNWHREFHAAVSGEAQQNAANTLSGWQREIQADKDFGGVNMKATVADARKALSAFDPDGELRTLLRESQYQHHPAIIRAIARVGRAMGEHAFIGANGEGGKASAPLEERLYKNMKTEG